MRGGTSAIRTAATVLAAGLAGACSLLDPVLGPVRDGDMSHAPYQACAYAADEPVRTAAGEPAPQCLRLTLDGRATGFESGPLRVAAGEELVAVPSGGAGCAGGFTHFVVAGSTPGAGAMRISVHDAFARGERVRRFRWDGAAAARRWTAAGIGSAIHNPATVRLSVERGALAATSLCLKGYSR